MVKCDPTANLIFRIDRDEKFVDFDFFKLACGTPILSQSGFRQYCRGRNLSDFLELQFSSVLRDLNITDEEEQFIVYLEWDALRSAIAKYLGTSTVGVDHQRCQITAIKHEDTQIEISEIILPPNNIPAINTSTFKD